MARYHLFDFLSRGFGHTSFNRTMIEVALARPECSGVVFYGEGAHLDWLRKIVPANIKTRCEFRPIECIEASANARLFRSWRSANWAIGTIKSAVRTPGDLVLVLGFTGLLLRQLRLSGLTSEIDLLCLAHGNLAEIDLPSRRNPLIQFRGMKTQLMAAARAGMRIAVLESYIRSDLISRPELAGLDVSCIELPVVPEEVSAADGGKSREPEDPHPIRVGFLGDPRPQKGFGAFLELAGMCRKGVEFHSVGRRVQGMPEEGLEVLTTRPAEQPYSREEFLEFVRSLDIVCIPLASEYGLIASASLLDAVASLKPLLYPANSVLDVFATRYGPIGYRYQDVDDASKLLSNLSFPTFVEDRRLFRENLARFRTERMPAAQASSLNI